MLQFLHVFRILTMFQVSTRSYYSDLPTRPLWGLLVSLLLVEISSLMLLIGLSPPLRPWNPTGLLPETTLPVFPWYEIRMEAEFSNSNEIIGANHRLQRSRCCLQCWRSLFRLHVSLNDFEFANYRNELMFTVTP